MFDNTKSDVQKLSHCCTDDLHWCFAVLTQAPGELFDTVMFHGGDRREVKGFSDSAATKF